MGVSSPPLACAEFSLIDGPPSASSIAKISSPCGGGSANVGRSKGLVVGECSRDCRPIIIFFNEPGGDILGESFADQSFWVGMMGTGISCNASHSLCVSSAARPSLSNRDTGDCATCAAHVWSESLRTTRGSRSSRILDSSSISILATM